MTPVRSFFLKVPYLKKCGFNTQQQPTLLSFQQKMPYPSRKPEPYVQAICKQCSNPLEFLPAVGTKNAKVEVQCWSCQTVATFEIDATGTKIKTTRSASKWSRKKGTGKNHKPNSLH